MSEPAEHFLPVWETSSHRFRPSDRFSYWNAQLAEYHDVILPDGAREADFEVRNTLWNLGGVLIVDARFSAHRQTRDIQKVRRGGADHYEIDLCLSGDRNFFASGTMSHQLRPGDLIMKDLGRPDDNLYEDSNHIVTVIARDFLDDALRSSPSIHGFMPTGPLATILADHLRHLAKALHKTPASAAPHIAQATTALVAAAINSSPTALDAARPHVQEVMRRRIMAHIDQNLENPQLSQELLCKVFSISRPSLYRLFRPLGGVAFVIQSRRLERIRNILKTEGARHHLGLLSERYAFSSQSQMSRSFRALYGCAPSDIGGSVELKPEGATLNDRPRFLQWMQELRKPVNL